MWHGKSLNARLARLALTPLSWLYAGGWEAYLATYRLGLEHAQEPHKPVICLGNLVAGGTGKSPIALYLASLIQSLGHEVVLGCSGYGAPHSESATLAPEGPLDAHEWGDEPAMMRWLAPNLPLIVGRDRVEAAHLCHEHFPNAVLLMDDGFQHLPVKKHLTILLDPPSDNHRCIPAGPYREPWRHRKRADLVLPNGFKPVMAIRSLETPDGKPEGAVRGNVLCALGNPDRFLSDLRAFGVTLEQSITLPDHDKLEVGNLFASLNPDLPLIVTAKDWVKLQRRSDLGDRKIFIARQEARIEPEAEFKAWLTRKLDELSHERPSP